MSDVGDRLGAAVGRVVIGHHAAVQLVLAALAARGHVLLEGPPGTAKSSIALTVASAAGQRVLMPERAADIARSIGDEGVWVTALRNPRELEGYESLPEAVVDRFAMRVVVDYPSEVEERALLAYHRDHSVALSPPPTSAAVVAPEELEAWRHDVAAVRMDDSLLDWIHALVRATRSHRDFINGAGPRAGLWMISCARGLALVRRRSYVLPDDVLDVSIPVLAHRVKLAPEALIQGLDNERALERLRTSIRLPGVAALLRERGARPS